MRNNGRVNNRVVLGFAWLAATIVMMVVTYSAVNLVGSSVTDQPLQASNTVQTTIADRVSGQGDTTTTSILLPGEERPVTGVLENVTSATSSTLPDGPTTTAASVAPPGTTPTSVATSPSSVTSSTSTTEPADKTTGPFPVTSGGGVITVSCTGDDVVFLGATPSAGYTMQIEDQGPEKVAVSFSSTENEWEIEVRCVDGRIDPRVELDEE